MYKFKIISIYFLFLLTLSTISQTSNSCENLVNKYSNEDILIEKIGSEMHIIKNESNKCIETLLKFGHLKALEYFVNELNQRGIKFRETLSSTINNMQKRLEDVHNKFRFDEADFQLVTPAFQWAQSMNHVFLEIKFAHRHDSPGCLEVKNETFELFENLLMYKAYCVLGDVPIKFDLNLELWHPVSSENSTHGSSSVGRYKITLKKKTAGMYWDKLLKESMDKPQNMKVWFEMREKFIDEIQSYLDDDDEEEFNRKTKENRIKAKEKNKKKKKAAREKSKAAKKLDAEEMALRQYDMIAGSEEKGDSDYKITDKKIPHKVDNMDEL